MQNLLKCVQYKSPSTYRCLEVFSVHFCCTSQVFNSESSVESKKRKHVYQERWRHKSVDSTNQYLLKQVVYHKDGLVCLNKPPDLGSSKLCPNKPSEDDFNIHHSLPFLAERLGYGKLMIASIPEKYVSGVTVLVSNAKLADEVSKALRRSKAVFSRDPKKTFLAVTEGHPILVENFQKYGVCQQIVNKKTHNLLLRDWGRNQEKKRTVHYGTVGHKVLDKSEFASLVSVSTWQDRLHLSRLFLSDVLISPALGDQKYGPKVTSLYGKPIVLKPWTAPAIKAVEPALLKKLCLESGSEAFIPLHFHLQELALYGLVGKKKSLVLRADPPDFFKWTCGQLDLRIPETEGCGVERIEEDDAKSTEVENALHTV